MEYPYQWKIKKKDKYKWGQIGRLEQKYRNRKKATKIKNHQIKDNEGKGYWPFTINAEREGLARTQVFEFKYWSFPKTPPKKKSDHEPKKQRCATEYTFVIEGEVRGWVEKDKVSLKAGDYIIIKPGNQSNLVEKILEDVRGITIKSPSCPRDTIRDC